MAAIVAETPASIAASPETSAHWAIEKTWTLVTAERTEGSIAEVVIEPAVKLSQPWFDAMLLICELDVEPRSELVLDSAELTSELALERAELTSELALDRVELTSGRLALTLALALALASTVVCCASAALPKLIAATSAATVT